MKKMKASKKLVSASDLSELKKSADVSEKGRSRVCLHETAQSPIQDMIIVFCEKSRILPHRRKSGIKTYCLLEGELDVFIFSEDGQFIEIVRMNRDTFLLSIQQTSYLMPVPLTKHVVIHEIASGPFIEGKDEYLHEEILEFENDFDKYILSLRERNS